MQGIVVMVPCHVQITVAVNHDADDVVCVENIAFESRLLQFKCCIAKFSFAQNNVAVAVVKSDVLNVAKTDERVFAKDRCVDGIACPTVGNHNLTNVIDLAAWFGRCASRNQQHADNGEKEKTILYAMTFQWQRC